MPSQALTAARARELLEYDLETGVFRWRVTNSNRAVAGTVAGVIGHGGYRYIRIDGCRCLAHRVACLMVTGEWPANEVDHRNGIRDENRWANLRQATRSQNRANTARTSRNTSGVKGVNWEARRGKWLARIMAAGRLHHIGYFDSLDEAAAARAKAAAEHHGEFARVA